MIYFPIKETEDEEGITSVVDEANEIITIQVETQATVLDISMAIILVISILLSLTINVQFARFVEKQAILL